MHSRHRIPRFQKQFQIERFQIQFSRTTLIVSVTSKDLKLPQKASKNNIVQDLKDFNSKSLATEANKWRTISVCDPCY